MSLQILKREFLGKWSNFTVANPHSNPDIACGVESVVPKLTHVLGMEFRWKIRSMLENSKPSVPNMAKNELRATKSLKLNKDIRILQADKGNCQEQEQAKYLANVRGL
jgi:hypothetical protein